MPLTLSTPAAPAPNGEYQPFCSGNAANAVVAWANEAASSEVKHCALTNTLSRASMVAAPDGSITSRPLDAPHRPTGTYTVAGGRKSAGSVNASALVPPAIAPLKWTIPPMFSTAASLVLYG